MQARLSHIRELLGNNGAARSLLERRQREIELLTQVRARLPKSMRSHCLGIGVTENRLTVFLDSPAWMTRARFLIEEIADSLKEQRIDEVRLQIRLTDDAASACQAATPARRLTIASARHLLEAADNTPDPELSRALKNFASRHLPNARTEED